MADLHADVAGRVLALEDVDLTLLEGSEGGSAVVHGDVHLAVRELGQGADAGLGGRQFAAEAEFGVRGERSGVERGHENVARTDLRVGDDAVGALDQPGPETALEECLADLPGVQFGCVPDSEVGALPLAVRLDQDGEQFALLSSDDLLDGAADRRGQEDVSVLFVCRDGGAAEHGVTFLDEKSRQETLEVRRLDGHDARRYRL